MDIQTLARLIHRNVLEIRVVAGLLSGSSPNEGGVAIGPGSVCFGTGMAIGGPIAEHDKVVIDMRWLREMSQLDEQRSIQEITQKYTDFN